MSSTKAALRLAENTDDRGDITAFGADRLVETVGDFAGIARSSGCGELMAFATSAVRDANNSEAVLSRVRAETGVNLEVLSGVDEARLTFLAVRRWYGWSAGRILNLDIGGGSLELTCGGDEDPDVAFSLQLGAGRLTRDWLQEDPRASAVSPCCATGSTPNWPPPRRSCAPRAPRTCASAPPRPSDPSPASPAQRLPVQVRASSAPSPRAGCGS